MTRPDWPMPFIEALERDPWDGWARRVLAEASTPGRPFWSLFLRYQRAVARVRGGERLLLAMGVYVIFRLVELPLRGHIWLVLPAGAAGLFYFTFVYCAWLGDLPTDLLLFRDRRTRRLLAGSQRLAAGAALAIWTLGLLAVIGCLWLGQGATAGHTLACSLALGLGAAHLRRLRPGWGRRLALVGTATLLIAGAAVPWTGLRSAAQSGTATGDLWLLVVGGSLLLTAATARLTGRGRRSPR